MKITSLTIGAARTFNLGNYESLRVEGAASGEYDPELGETIADLRQRLLAELRTSLEEAYREFKPKKLA